MDKIKTVSAMKQSLFFMFRFPLSCKGIHIPTKYNPVQ